MSHGSSGYGRVGNTRRRKKSSSSTNRTQDGLRRSTSGCCFELQRHWYQSETWDDLFRFVVRSRPRIDGIPQLSYEPYDFQMEVSTREGTALERLGRTGLEPRTASRRTLQMKRIGYQEGGNFRRYVSITNPPQMPDDVLIPPIDFTSSAHRQSQGGVHASPREETLPREGEGPTRGSPVHEEETCPYPGRRKRCGTSTGHVQAIWEITASQSSLSRAGRTEVRLGYAL